MSARCTIVNLRVSILLATFTLAVTGCARPERDARKVLHRVGAGALRQQAALLYKDVFAAPKTGLITIKRQDWPASFAAFEPLSVGAYRDGFALAIERESGRESGVYVIPAQMDVRPRQTQRTRFTRIEDGIYWYVFEL